MIRLCFPFFLFLWCVLVAIFISGLTGCSTVPRKEGDSSKKAVPTLQQSLQPSLDKLILVGVIGVGVGFGLFFVVPAAHQLSITIAGVAGGLEGSALLLRVGLTPIVWVVYILIGLGAIALGYEVFQKLKAKGVM